VRRNESTLGRGREDGVCVINLISVPRSVAPRSDPKSVAPSSVLRSAVPSSAPRCEASRCFTSEPGFLAPTP